MCIRDSNEGSTVIEEDARMKTTKIRPCEENQRLIHGDKGDGDGGTG